MIMPYTCDIFGCTHDATHYTVRGCAEGHVDDNKMCFPCMRSHQDRVQENIKGISQPPWRMECLWHHPVTDMLIYDPVKNITWDAEGITETWK